MADLTRSAKFYPHENHRTIGFRSYSIDFHTRRRDHGLQIGIEDIVGDFHLEYHQSIFGERWRLSLRGLRGPVARPRSYRDSSILYLAQ